MQGHRLRSLATASSQREQSFAQAATPAELSMTPSTRNTRISAVDPLGLTLRSVAWLAAAGAMLGTAGQAAAQEPSSQPAVSGSVNDSATVQTAPVKVSAAKSGDFKFAVQ